MFWKWMLKKYCLPLFFFFFIIDVAGLSDSVARAESKEEMAKVHFNSGRAYFQQGKFKDAIREFNSAYELSKKPELFYNISICWERLGDLEKAIAFREKYVEALPQAANAERIKLQIDALKKRLQATTVTLKGGPKGAHVAIDGKKAGELPLLGPLKVSPGVHKIVVTKNGYTRFVSTVAVTGGQAVVVEIEMEVLAGSQTEKSKARDGSSADDDDSPGPDPRKTEEKDSVSSKKIQKEDRPYTGGKRIWTWVTLGVGGAVLAGGLTLGLLAYDAAGDANSKLSSNDLDGYDKNKKTAKVLGLSADVMYGIGGAFVVTGVVLFFLEAGKEKPSKSVGAVVPFFSPEGAGISWAGFF